VGRRAEEDDVQIEELIRSARDTLTVQRVFGEPYERDGVTVLPVASVGGGGGGGGGHDSDGQVGEGLGFGLVAKPAGVYVIADGKVRWLPAVDVNRLAFSLVALTTVLATWRVRAAKARARRARG
jgi:uncharacterized spore protein YtfJ